MSKEMALSGVGSAANNGSSRTDRSSSARETCFTVQGKCFKSLLSISISLAYHENALEKGSGCVKSLLPVLLRT